MILLSLLKKTSTDDYLYVFRDPITTIVCINDPKFNDISR